MTPESIVLTTPAPRPQTHRHAPPSTTRPRRPAHPPQPTTATTRSPPHPAAAKPRPATHGRAPGPAGAAARGRTAGHAPSFASSASDAQSDAPLSATQVRGHRPHASVSLPGAPMEATPESAPCPPLPPSAGALRVRGAAAPVMQRQRRARSALSGAGAAPEAPLPRAARRLCAKSEQLLPNRLQRQRATPAAPKSPGLPARARRDGRRAGSPWPQHALHPSPTALKHIRSTRTNLQLSPPQPLL